MTRVLRLLLRARTALVALSWLGAMSMAQLAQGQEEEAAEEVVVSESWTLGYALVILAVVLGLVLVCRPVLRKRDLSGGE